MTEQTREDTAEQTEDGVRRADAAERSEPDAPAGTESPSETRTAVVGAGKSWLRRPSLGGFSHGIWLGFAVALALVLTASFVLGYTMGHLAAQKSYERVISQTPGGPPGFGGGSGSDRTAPGGSGSSGGGSSSGGTDSGTQGGGGVGAGGAGAGGAGGSSGGGGGGGGGG